MNTEMAAAHRAGCRAAPQSQLGHGERRMDSRAAQEVRHC